MFSPSRTDVRAFFVEARRKRLAGMPTTPLEAIAADWVDGHPEYERDLAAAGREANAEADADADAAALAGDDGGRENPFLHLSMHLSISEQVQIDQPAGIRAAFLALARRLGSQHAAQHEVMECLGRMLWESQRAGRPPDGEEYVACVRRRVG